MNDDKECFLIEKIARLEERLIASDKALELAVKAEALAARVAILEKSAEHNVGKKEGVDKTWAYLVVILGLIFGLIEIFLRIQK